MPRSLRLLAFALLLSPLAHASELRAPVMDLLNAYEETATPEQLRALGEGVDAELMLIADDKAVPTSRRARAISALGSYTGDTVRAFLEARLAEADKGVFQRKAAYSLAAVAGPDSVVPLTAALNDEGDTQLRIAAAHALGSLSEAPARAALEARQGIEREDAVKVEIEKSMGGR